MAQRPPDRKRRSPARRKTHSSGARNAQRAPASRAGPKASDARGAPSQPAAPVVLAESQRRYLRGLAHELKPVVRLGTAGLTDAVVAEAGRALRDHELIKVKADMADRTQRDELLEQLATRTASALVQRIGKVAVLYRPRAGLSRIMLPDSEPYSKRTATIS